MNRRNILQAIAGGIGPAALLQATAGSRILSQTLGADAVKVEHAAYGEGQIYFDGPTDQLKSLTAGSVRLNPGSEPHPPHQHPEEEIMLVTEGHGRIVVDGKTTEVGPGAMMYCAGGKVHGIHNTGDAPLLFYFYKWRA